MTNSDFHGFSISLYDEIGIIRIIWGGYFSGQSPSSDSPAIVRYMTDKESGLYSLCDFSPYSMGKWLKWKGTLLVWYNIPEVKTWKPKEVSTDLSEWGNPGVTEGNPATDSPAQSDLVADILNRHNEVKRLYSQADCESRVKKMLAARERDCNEYRFSLPEGPKQTSMGGNTSTQPERRGTLKFWL